MYGDGNCFFHAVSDQLRGTPLQMDHLAVRRVMAQRALPLLQQHADLLHAERLTVARVVTDTQSSGIYVHDVMVPLLDRIFDVDFAIYQIDDADRSALRFVQGARAATQPPVATVFLLFDRRREHYDSLRLDQGVAAEEGVRGDPRRVGRPSALRAA